MTTSIFRFLLAISLAGAMSGCSSINWERDYKTGLQRVGSERRRALVEFVTAMNAESREMDEVFEDPEVQRLMQNFIPIRVDAIMDKQLADQYGVQTLPAFYIIRADYTVAGVAAGKMDADKFRAFLIKHTFD